MEMKTDSMGHRLIARLFGCGIVRMTGFLVFLIAPVAAIPAEPTPLMKIRLRAPHTADDAQWAKTFKALVENPGCCDEVWFSTGIGLPKLSDHMANVERLKRYAAQLREKRIVPSLQVQATLGHSDSISALESNEAKNWGGFMGRGGIEAKYCSCPRQPAFLAYEREMARIYAAFGPSSVWIDDDLRICGHAPASPWNKMSDGWIGCWCSRCIADFNRETGGRWTRETLDVAAAKNPVLFARWVVFSESSIVEVARTIAAAFHEVSPKTRVAFQHSSGIERDDGRLLRAMHEVTGLPVYSRPGGGAYFDCNPENQLQKAYAAAKKIRAIGKPEWIGTFCPEIETCPRAFGSRTAQGLFNEALMSLACGMDSLSFLIMDTRSEDDAWYSKVLLGPLARARPLLEDYLDFNADAEPAGLDVPLELQINDVFKVAMLGVPILTGVGKAYGTLTKEDCVLGPLGSTTSRMIMDLRRKLDARSGGNCPVLVEEPTVGPVLPRVSAEGMLKSVAMFNCRIDRQAPVRLRLRGVRADVTEATWQAFRGERVKLAVMREGAEAFVTVPEISAWNCGWLKLVIKAR